MTSASTSLEATWQQAFKHHQQGELVQAHAHYKKVLAQAPQHFDALHMMGVLALQQGRAREAVEWMQQALALKIDHADLYINLGSALQSLQETQAALHCLETAAALSPDKPQIWFNQGNLYQSQGRTQEAIQAYQHAIDLAPHYTQALTNLGLCWQQGQRADLALSLFERVLALTPHDVEALYNTGNALKDLQQWQRALTQYDQALAIDPTHVSTWYNKGTALQETLALDEAIACYERVIQLQPTHAKAHWNLSICLLLLGRLQAAWPLYEWRWHVQETQLQRPATRQAPAWQGESLRGRSIWVYAEQGLGDTLQFVRYVPLLNQLGAQVVLQMPRTLHALLQPVLQAQLLDVNDPVVNTDFQCALLDLPRVLNTGLDDIPPVLEGLTPDSQLKSKWFERLNARSHRTPRIGLVWQGSAHHLNDARRSIPLAELLSHLPLGPHYVSLQKEIKPTEIAQLDQAGVAHFEQVIEDFSDTAALAACMDGVISVDTSVAHLCGSLQIPTLLLLPYVADWRWLAHGSQSAWYPCFELLRQDASRQWASVLTQLPAYIHRSET